MKSQKSGAIVNISSDIGFSGDASRSAYAAAKAGIVGFSKTLALELAPFGVRANVVAPGRIATKRVRATYSDAEWEAAAKRIPLGHAGEPEDIAEAVAFLASDCQQPHDRAKRFTSTAGELWGSGSCDGSFNCCKGSCENRCVSPA